MDIKIIHNREVYINEDGNVISDIDGKIPFNKWYNVYYNASGLFTVECIRKQEKAGKIEWRA